MNALSVIDHMLRDFSNVQKAYEAAKTEVNYRDGEANDLNHAIEFGKFNAYEGYMLSKQLQENRQARREAKDTVEELEQLYESMVRFKRFSDDLKQVRKSVESIRQKQKSRTYRPRFRNDLFDKVK